MSAKAAGMMSTGKLMKMLVGRTYPSTCSHSVCEGMVAAAATAAVARRSASASASASAAAGAQASMKPAEELREFQIYRWNPESGANTKPVMESYTIDVNK